MVPPESSTRLADEHRRQKTGANSKMSECRVCSQPFDKARMGQVVCGVACAKKLPVINRKAERADRKATKQRLAALKTRSQWMKEAKTAMQKMRRLEELSAGHGCMSCGRSQQEVAGTDGWKPGGAWDGGHYIGKGARPELALEPRNIWLQCKSCNGGSGKYARKAATVNQSFRANLIERIGLDAVEGLESDHRPQRHTIEDLQRIIADCRARAKELQKENTND